MAHIQHINPDSTSIAHKGKVYKTLGEGVFEVPHEVAQELARFPSYRHYDGKPWPEPAPKTEEEKRAREIREAVHQAIIEATSQSAATPRRSRKKSN